jgi:hypothetical protein
MFLLLFAMTAHVGFRERWQAPISPMYTGFYLLMATLLLILFYKGNLFAPGPINQPTKALAAITFLVLFIFVARYTAVALAKWGRAYLSGRGRAATCWWLAGFAMGLVETYVFSRLSRHMPGGPGYGMMWLGAAFAAGLGAGLILWPGRNKPSPIATLSSCTVAAAAIIGGAFIWPGQDKSSLVVTLVAGAAAAVALLVTVSSFPAIGGVALAAVILGFATGLFASAAFARAAAGQSARAVAIFLLGALAGLYAFQWFVVLFGHFMAACLIIAVFVNLFVLLLISSKKAAPETR